MAQVFGFLREDKATHGEKTVLKLLKDNLPKEFAIYVECPIPGRRVHRYPDFIVVTNYGVIVLEVKDWIQVTRADRYGAEIRTRNNQNRKVDNPVNQARDIALLLVDELKSVKNAIKQRGQINIPWGYAVVLPNLPLSTITQLRRAWGEEFVLNKDDLDAPLILSRLRVTLPEDKVRDLKKFELDFIRATINPTVLIEPQNRPALILDASQELIVSEPVQIETDTQKPTKPEASQVNFFVDTEAAQPPTIQDYTIDLETRISRNASIRLVRGVAGSGKTLVLTQRARYLAAQFPEWSIAVLTYNDQLKQHFEATFKGIKNVKPLTFHGLCSLLLRGNTPWKEPSNPDGWLENQKQTFGIISELGVPFIADEFQWIKEVGVSDREKYLNIERKGRGQLGRLSKTQRSQVYDLLEAYQKYLDQEDIPDWADIPYLVLKAISEGRIQQQSFDAILIDEAQDFAPIWLQVVTKLLNPEHGVLFLSDDPAQSIYRFFSWKEKGIGVVGRTRWLRVPYRNTYEIYQAAYQLVATDPKLQASLEEEGMLVSPDLSASLMRHGPKPLIQRFSSFKEEISGIQNQIAHLLQQGYDGRQIAVLHRKANGVRQLRATLKGCGVNINTFHAYKGLEFDAVFLTQLQETNVHKGTDEEISAERRLVYMAMTRARDHLYMGYEGKLPNKYLAMKEYVDMIE